MKSAIKRHGGKFYLAPKIIETLNQADHTHFLDAYAGALNVLLNKPSEGIAEYVNDIDKELTTFWYVLQSQPDKLMYQLNVTPFSHFEFETAQAVNSKLISELDRAVRFFILNRMSRQALEKDFATPVLSRLRRGMNEQVSSYLAAVDGLAEIVARLRRVEIWNIPAVEAIKKLDHSKLLVYCDPPYLHETRVTTTEYGKHEMTPEQHRELLTVLSEMQGKFVLSGYPSKLYSSFEAVCGWRRQEIEIPNNASSSKVKEIKTECLWSNF